MSGAPLAVQADSHGDAGFYLAGSAGLQQRNRSAESDIIWTDWQNGYDLSLLGGYRFENQAWIEVEWVRYQNDADVVSGGQLPDGTLLVADGSGEAVLDNWFVNAGLDFEVNPRWILRVGAGIGQMTSDVRKLTNEIIEPFGFIFDGRSEDWVTAWQFKSALSYQASDNLEVFGQYRFMDADKLEFEFHLPNGLIFPAGPRDTKISSVEIGLRYNF